MGGYLRGRARGALYYPPGGLDVAGQQADLLWEMHDLAFFFARKK